MNDPGQPDNRGGGSGIGRDLRSVRDNGSASLRELREFITHLKGRRPQEVMGMVTSNGLVQGIVISAASFAVLLLLFTAIPFFLADEEPVAGKAPAPAAKVKSDQSAGQSQGAGDKKQEQAGSNAAGENVSNALGIGETKASSLEENPLENKLDNLLDDVK